MKNINEHPVRTMNYMASLQDIRLAYLNGSGTCPDTSNVSKWISDTKVNLLIEYLEDSVHGGGMNPSSVAKVHDGHLFVCRDVAISYASWLDVTFSTQVSRMFDDIIVKLILNKVLTTG